MERGLFAAEKILYEPQFPNLLFAVDGEVYRFGGRNCLAVGGAYSTGKAYRLAKGMGWWPDEQPSEKTKRHVEQLLDARGWQMDMVLTHTCPLRYKPLKRSSLILTSPRSIAQRRHGWIKSKNGWITSAGTAGISIRTKPSGGCGFYFRNSCRWGNRTLAAGAHVRTPPFRMSLWGRLLLRFE